MSKIMNDLNRLNDSRKETDNIVIDEASESPEQVQPVGSSKRSYFLGFLIVLLIAISALSMSFSLKIFSKLEHSMKSSKTILLVLDKQGQAIKALEPAFLFFFTPETVGCIDL